MINLLKPKQGIPRSVAIGSFLTGFILLLLVWSYLSHSYKQAGKSVLFPSPVAVWNVALDYVGTGPEAKAYIEKAKAKNDPEALVKAEKRLRKKIHKKRLTLWQDLKVSVLRVTYGFLLTLVVALPIGMLIGAFRLFESMIQPICEFIRFIPVPALSPLMIVFFGIDELPKIMLIFVGTVFQLTLMIADEVRRVPDDLIRTGYTLGGSHGEIIGRIMLPAAMPGIYDSIRICHGWAWTWLIVAELVAANEGLGFRIIGFQRFLKTDQIFFYLFILGVIGLLADFFFKTTHKRLYSWSKGKAS